MRTTTAAKNERVEARLTPEDKKLLQRAADLTGRSLSEFVLDSARRAAEEAILSRQVIDLTLRDAEVIMAALLNPPKPTEEHREEVRRYRELVTRE